MISFTPKKHQDYPKLKLKGTKVPAPSELTIRLIMSYAAALRVYNTKSLGCINSLLN
jgi:hypothetical protein